MRSLIIDNEAPIVRGLRKMLQRFCPQIELIGIASGVQEGLALIAQTQPELIFLDVEMDDGTGMDLLAQVGKRDFQVIFITAYDHYALDAFRFSALDYLLKPIDPEDLIRAVHKAQANVEKDRLQQQLSVLLSNAQSPQPNNRKIVLRDADNFHIVLVSEILHCQAEGSYTRFFLEDGQEILVSKNLKEYEKLLEGQGFFRPHHSHLVQLDSIVRINKADHTLNMRNGHIVPVSTRKKDQLIAMLNQIGN
jgi:two-component system LytT family response regulator